jgi:hypothetical protein
MKSDSLSTKTQSPKRQERLLKDENQAFLEEHQEEEAHSRSVSTQNTLIFSRYSNLKGCSNLTM